MIPGMFTILVLHVLHFVCDANAAAIIRYDFSQVECGQSKVEDVVGGDRYFGDLVLDTSTTSCLSGIGIERTSESPGSPGASSFGNITSLREDLLNDSSSPGHFSLELWLSIESMPSCDNNNCAAPILTIGERGVSLDDDCEENMGMMLTYWTETGDFGARFQSAEDECEVLWSGAMQSSSNMGYALHLVLTLDRIEFYGDPYAYFEWFLNGTRVARDVNKFVPPETMMTSWDPDFNLQLLDSSRQVPSSIFSEAPGIKIFYLALHDETLDATAVSSRYATRIHNSTPVVHDAIVGVAEDGENGDHYGEPETYLQEFPVSELQLVPLWFYDSDNDPATPHHDSTNPRVFVNTLPFQGSLVHASGDDIISAPFEVLEDEGAFAVRYRPLMNDFSTNVTGTDYAIYANFSFYAIDESSSIRSQTNATVSMYVFPKNDPPEAFNASHVAYAGTRQNIISLHGKDMDEYDEVNGAAVVRLPTKGTLFQVFDNGSASDVIVTSGELLWRESVAYEHDVRWLSSNFPAAQTVGNDTFSFKVFDLHSNFSVPAEVNVTVLSGVSVFSDQSVWRCFEDTDCDIRLYGSALDDSQGNISITITGIPFVGILLEPITKAFIGEGSTLASQSAYPYDTGASVTYRPPTDFFTHPDSEWNGTELPSLVEFTVISFYASIELGSATLSSVEISQQLRIVNVDDQSAMTCGDHILHTQATGIVDADLAFDYARPDRLFINDFSISEKDKGVDPVRVSVDVESGYLTLNETSMSKVSFDPFCSGTFDWLCRGDGIFTRRMVFVGAPKDVQKVLNGMLFVTYESNAMDNITVIIHDGSGGECIRDFNSFSRRPTCHSSNCSRIINVTETWLGDDTSKDALLVLTISEFFALFALISASIGVVVCYFLKSLCFCCRFRRHRRNKTCQNRRRRGLNVVDGEVTALPALKRTPITSSSARRTPAAIPPGRAEKETTSISPIFHEPLCPLLRLGLLRRLWNKPRNAGQGILRVHVEEPDEMTWEDDD